MSPETTRSIRDDLRAIGDPLFALLDAARTPGVLAALHASDQPHQTLYEGAEADNLAAFGPYLVSLDGDDALLTRLIAQGWGQAWGVYLTSPADFGTIRHHLRHYLRVEIPGGRSALFRFYDPRVLREFFATWTPDELAAFFGPVTGFAIEDEAGSLTPRRYRPPVLDFEHPPRPR